MEFYDLFRGRRESTVRVRPSLENGWFVGLYRGVPRIGQVAVLHGVEVTDLDALETGRFDVLNNYLRVDPDRPGHFLEMGVRITMPRSDTDYSFEPLDPGTFVELMPFVPQPSKPAVPLPAYRFRG